MVDVTNDFDSLKKEYNEIKLSNAVLLEKIEALKLKKTMIENDELLFKCLENELSTNPTSDQPDYGCDPPGRLRVQLIL